MWNTLSLTENEAITLHIDPQKLSVSKFSLIGKIAMKKHVSLYDVDKGLKSIWKVENELETTQLGENLYLLAFKSAQTVERILENQPWNFRGALLILDRATGDTCQSISCFRRAH